MPHLLSIPLALAAATGGSPCHADVVRTIDLSDSLTAIETRKACEVSSNIDTLENEIFVCQREETLTSCKLAARFDAVGVAGAPITVKTGVLLVHLKAGARPNMINTSVQGIKVRVAYDDTTERYLHDEKLMKTPMVIDPVLVGQSS